MWHRNNYVYRSNAVGASVLAFLAGAAVWAIFGKKMKDKLNDNPKFQELKDKVYKKASEVQDLTREKYDQIVDEVSDKYGRLQGISKHELVDLVDDLKMHWGRMKRAWNE